MRIDLTGKVALVTGAARGIGLGIADLLVANGAQAVVYADIDFATAKVEAGKSPAGAALAMDVSNEAQVEAGIAQVLKQHRQLDILVNNAGVNTLKHRVNVDLTGMFLVSRAASRSMIKRKTGRIINIASVLGVTPARLQCAFTTAKAGVIHFTRTIAIELAPSNILVN